VHFNHPADLLPRINNHNDTVGTQDDPSVVCWRPMER